jgi:hypothetical protein
VLKETEEAEDLTDIWRVKNPNTKRFTWRQNNPFISSRLYYWLISKDFCGFITKADILPTISSDHAPIIMKIRTFENKPGRGLWKLNNSYLNDDLYIREVKAIITDLKEEEPITDTGFLGIYEI